MTGRNYDILEARQTVEFTATARTIAPALLSTWAFVPLAVQ